MAKRSTRENKTVYQLKREEAGLTREKAGEQMQFVSEDRIERIESGKMLPHSDEIVAMAECYKAPLLCNYYCANECPIGSRTVTELEEKELSQIVLELLASLNALTKEKDRLIEIAVDGKISEDEYRDFVQIRDKLNQISASVDSMRFWVEKTIMEGKIDPDRLR